MSYKLFLVTLLILLILLLSASGAIAQGPPGPPGPPSGGGWTDDGNVVRLTTSTDRVGIGTSSPAAKLETRGNAIISNSALTTEDLNDRTLLLGPRPSHTGVVSLGFQVNASSKAGIDYAVGPDDGLGFAVYNGTWFLPDTYDLFIKKGGNVGIGTKSPQDKLEVKDGNIRVTNGNFIDDGTTLNAPDYVFEEGYTLLPLDDLHAYVTREKHLPNVPSAAEIQRDGLNLSQFQMKLLEKIEELTLYTLAQQQEIETLRQQNAELQTRLEALEQASSQK